LRLAVDREGRDLSDRKSRCGSALLLICCAASSVAPLAAPVFSAARLFQCFFRVEVFGSGFRLDSYLSTFVSGGFFSSTGGGGVAALISCLSVTFCNEIGELLRIALRSAIFSGFGAACRIRLFIVNSEIARGRSPCFRSHGIERLRRERDQPPQEDSRVKEAREMARLGRKLCISLLARPR